ncbi:hypothetical protein BC936DRAFT_140123 [Jimgerdemannia flammicorona]|uniref:Uncharacterized protein n=1 Tax=Jimgerdemannia flammicorona TaxID=994334 RepID=A0A433B0Z1_9FUNG|nr:hypothetical protein BC936DRAFT_140123 [Jimgerdemannia flammicorona]
MPMLGLSSIIDISSEFPGGMHEWFGKDWPTLKAKVLEHLNVTTKQFDDPVRMRKEVFVDLWN